MTIDYKINDLEQKLDKALISVIVPVYNVEKYLKQCLDSLLAQTYSNIEVIMVDDGSQDSSRIICDEYAEKYDNFYVIHKKNAGLGMARNTGLEYIQGQYVAFMDSDDYLEENCIKDLYEKLIQNDVDMCKGGFKRVVDTGEVISERNYRYELFANRKARFELLPRMIGSSPTSHDSIEMSVCGALYNAEPIKKYGLEFPSERELISEDLVFNIDYLQYAKGACIISETGYNYRVNLQSLTTNYRKDRFEASKHFYLEMKKKLIDLKYDKLTMLRLDRMFFIYLRMCIRQESYRISKNKREISCNNIKRICKDSTVRKIIAEYPVNKLEFKQRIFLYLLKYNMNHLFYFLAEKGVL